MHGQTLPTKSSAVDVASGRRRLRACLPWTQTRQRGSSSSSLSSSSLWRLFVVDAASTTSSSAVDAASAKSPSVMVATLVFATDCEEEA